MLSIDEGGTACLWNAETLICQNQRSLGFNPSPITAVLSQQTLVVGNKDAVITSKTSLATLDTSTLAYKWLNDSVKTYQLLQLEKGSL